MSIEKVNIELDSFCNKTIKSSFVGLMTKSFFTYCFNFTTGLSKYSKLLNNVLIVSILALLSSLALPQFASDRFGIGLIIIICFIVFSLNVLCKNIKVFSFNSLDFLIMVFLLLCFISTFSSYFFKESLTGLLKYAIFFSGYFLIKQTLLNSNSNILKLILYTLFVTGLIVSLIGVYQYIIGVEPLATWEDPNAEDIHTRVYSTLGNPNLLAGYLLLILPLGLCIPFEFKLNNFLKLFFLAGSLVIIVSIIFTGSRAGYIALFSQILISIFVLTSNFISTKKSKINPYLLILILGLIVILAFSILVVLFPVIKERILTIFTFREHSSNSYRLNVWQSCFEMLKDNFFIGIGPGNSTFRLAYGIYMVSGFDALAAYNIFLEFAVEIGFLGFFISILVFLISFLKLHFIFWKYKSFLSLGIFISLIGVLIQGMFDTVFFRPQIFIPYWLLIGLIAKLEERGNLIESKN